MRRKIANFPASNLTSRFEPFIISNSFVTPPRTIQIAAWVLALGVAIGAFGAHALEDLLIATGRQSTFETAVRYQMYHGLALLVLGFAGHLLKPSLLANVARLFLAGIVLFSGSLYALCLLQLPILGAITPLGGVCFIAGWVTLALGARIKKN